MATEAPSVIASDDTIAALVSAELRADLRALRKTSSGVVRLAEERARRGARS